MADPLQGNLDRTVTQDELVGEKYKDADGATHIYPVMGQGPAKLASASDLEMDELGYTNPNLHRRVEVHPFKKADHILNQEVEDRKYQLGIQNVHSYRTTTITVHDEESTDSEIP